MISTMSKALALSTLAAVASAAGSYHVVQVGQGGLTFSPNSLSAAVGDKVVFVFDSPAHSATQGDFDNPCQPLNSTSWNSGYVNPGTNDFVVTINSTEPMYYYCQQVTHCQAGMAAAINAPSGKSAADYIAASMKTSKTVPQTDVQGGVFVKSGSADAAPSSTTGGSSTSSPTASPSSSGNAASHLQQASGLSLLAVLLGFAL